MNKLKQLAQGTLSATIAFFGFTLGWIVIGTLILFFTIGVCSVV